MSLYLNVKRVNSLPTPVQPSTLYIVKSSIDGLVDLYFTSTDGSDVRKVINQPDVKALISGSTIDWNQLANGPLSNVAEIDAAVASMHTHFNKPILDLIEEDADGNFMFNGGYPRVPLEACEW